MIKRFNEYKGTDSNLSDDIEIIEIDMDSDIDDDKLDIKEFEIESIIDVIIPENESITTHTGPNSKNYKRGDIIYITALLRKKGTTSFNSPAKQGVLKVRIVDLYYGLQYLNKVIN